MLDKYQKLLDTCRKTQRYRDMVINDRMKIVQIRADLRIIKKMKG